MSACKDAGDRPHLVIDETLSPAYGTPPFEASGCQVIRLILFPMNWPAPSRTACQSSCNFIRPNLTGHRARKGNRTQKKRARIPSRPTTCRYVGIGNAEIFFGFFCICCESAKLNEPEIWVNFDRLIRIVCGVHSTAESTYEQSKRPISLSSFLCHCVD